jgi:hypothetical protein
MSLPQIIVAGIGMGCYTFIAHLVASYHYYQVLNAKLSCEDLIIFSDCSMILKITSTNSSTSYYFGV